jgi:ubiquinone/menaquinone biosynthesis C-methylase UbiE
MDEAAVASFWQTHPCGDALIGGLQNAFEGDYESFFTAYDNNRYEVEYHIPGCLDDVGVSGERLLEIGLGQGAESEQLIRRGANWSGLDVTPEAVDRVRTRLRLRSLPFADLQVGSATQIPWDDDQFDIVFSHGVLHHIPDILAAQREIHRVLHPDGRLVVMLYARRSLNYQVSIRLVRRAMLLAAWPFRDRIQSPMLAGHLANAKREGLFRYLQINRFTHYNTDGPENPYALVYNLSDVHRDFPLFEVVRSHKHFMHAPPLPVHGWPGGQLMGWHLWVEMKPR